MVAESTASFSKLLALGRLLNGKASEQTSQTEKWQVQASVDLFSCNRRPLVPISSWFMLKTDALDQWFSNMSQDHRADLLNHLTGLTLRISDLEP